VFHACAVAALAQSLLITEELGDLAHYGRNLVLLDESVQAYAEVWISGESAAYAD
jgi:hypothetical protein